MDPDRRQRMMQTTRWSLVRRAACGGKSLEEWVDACWFPLYTWARQKGWSPEDAADAVQDFLGKICRRELLATVDPARGKLRSWLLASFGNHLASVHATRTRQKRGGGNATRHIDWATVEKEYHHRFADGLDPEQAYSQAWALSLMDEALQRLSRHYCETGRERIFEVLLPSLEQAPGGATYESLASELGMSGAALRQAAVRLRQRYRQYLLEVAGERLGITDAALLHQELRELFQN